MCFWIKIYDIILTEFYVNFSNTLSSLLFIRFILETFHFGFSSVNTNAAENLIKFQHENMLMEAIINNRNFIYTIKQANVIACHSCHGLSDRRMSKTHRSEKKLVENWKPIEFTIRVLFRVVVMKTINWK